MRFAVACTLLWLLLVAAPETRADTRLGDSCDLAIVGATDKSAFQHFDAALREAVKTNNASAVTRMVRYPVLLNFDNGSHERVGDAATLATRLSAAWPKLAQGVSAQAFDRLFCNAEGVMYGNGEVWASPSGSAAGAPFRITSFNLAAEPAAAVAKAPVEPKHDLACSTDRFRIVIDANGEHGARYRSWDVPHPTDQDKQALELIGQANGEGTGSCFHRVWNFRNGNTDYILSEPGCSEGDIPQNAKAQLDVLVGGRMQVKSWCF